MQKAGTVLDHGSVVPVDIPRPHRDSNTGPSWSNLPHGGFRPTGAQAAVVMMIGGEFNTPADWLRTGNAAAIVDSFAQSHGGQRPVLVFVDSGGSFNNDTECVNGTRGNVADHITKDVVPYVNATFGTSSAGADWGIVGWSMGGTCAVDLTVHASRTVLPLRRHRRRHGTHAGTKDQTVARLYGGSEAAWAQFDPATVMAKHGPYQGVSGWFAISNRCAQEVHMPHSEGAVGLGGRDADGMPPIRLRPPTRCAGSARPRASRARLCRRRDATTGRWRRRCSPRRCPGWLERSHPGVQAVPLPAGAPVAGV